ncbi:hypothetical protein BDDG_07051 [Blastomyces dermatitidis ATCC 18188]|uniref:Uncharacterized protein n=1 Tax=Ajellomyces dermatitidis (strain ATCC 18188 / CBS 674.68) TaxID=653446 RepID=F2TLF8_AJEDA|nr:hypothetical protein BDDG_07051 [Blastomyces dermatitidis ATCC 18188]
MIMARIIFETSLDVSRGVQSQAQAGEAHGEETGQRKTVKTSRILTTTTAGSSLTKLGLVAGRHSGRRIDGSNPSEITIAYPSRRCERAKTQLSAMRTGRISEASRRDSRPLVKLRWNTG